ncbi:Ulp1 protease family [Vigna unguiculata]|uniref:Ulp1 protease family n=1 Tax=Vigna unguiculata TaxID=3917 RepID=A0A4D6LG17_VIGUN|nr:Ulp1 protease family [Vigna unguiculata]
MGFRPIGYICNMAVLFATNVMMYNERKLHEHVQRIIMNPILLVGMQDILSAEFLFAPIVHGDHWWCYCVKLKSMEFFVFDSLGHSRKNRTRIENYIKPSFEVQCVDTPIQPNGRDCGVLVLKFIEMWDGVSKFDGKAWLTTLLRSYN